MYGRSCRLGLFLSLTTSQKKILVNAEALPVISGYGISKFPHLPTLFSSRFSSPESFSGDGDRTKSGDVYAFSMVALEVGISSQYTFHSLMLIFRLCRGFNPTIICPTTTLLSATLFKVFDRLENSSISQQFRRVCGNFSAPCGPKTRSQDLKWLMLCKN
jgi:hypothetical protein